MSVTIYDAAGLLFVHKDLAEKYRLKGKDTAEACHFNANVALAAGRRDLAQVWQLAALAAGTPPLPLPLASHWSENDEDSPSAWAAHPFGRSMIESLIQHYAAQSDVQTAAMLSCMFGSRSENHPTLKKKISNANVSVRNWFGLVISLLGFHPWRFLGAGLKINFFFLFSGLRLANGV